MECCPTVFENPEMTKPPGGGFVCGMNNLYSPASAFSAATLSSASQVNSGSSRPKWP